MIVGLGEGAGEVGQLGNLRVVEPAFEAEAALAQLGEALAVGLVEQQLRPRLEPRVGHVVGGVPAGVMADAAEARAHRHVRVEHLADGRAELQVGVADDARAGAHLAVVAARALRRDAGDELRLTDRPQRLRPVAAIHRAALNEDGLAHIEVGRVFKQLVEKVARAREVPQVVVRIDDRQVGLNRRFVRRREP